MPVAALLLLLLSSLMLATFLSEGSFFGPAAALSAPAASAPAPASSPSLLLEADLIGGSLLPAALTVLGPASCRPPAAAALLAVSAAAAAAAALAAFSVDPDLGPSEPVLGKPGVASEGCCLGGTAVADRLPRVAPGMALGMGRAGLAAVGRRWTW